MVDAGVDDASAGWAGARNALATDVRRVADRLRSLSLARLAAPVPPFSSRAEAGHRIAQVLADAAQGIEDRHEADEPPWRELPALGDLAVGDQVTVTGQDLLTATGVVAPVDTVWARGRRRTAGEVLEDAAARLAEVRRLL